MNEVVEHSANPFAADRVTTAAVHSNAAAATDSNRAIAEVQAAMLIAKMNPRDPVAAMDRILNACSRAGLADAAVFTYARGGTDITGPSIRLAEAMAQDWGNIQFGIRELEQRAGESTVQAYAWDVERNTRREITFQVPHVRHTKKGQYKLEDPRDIYETVANNGARRLRACILAVIPGDVTEAAVAQCELTMKSKADVSPEAMQKMVAAFEVFGVTREQIEARIQRRLDAIQPAQVVGLKKIYASLRDGMSIAVEWFDVPPPGEGAQTATAPVSRTDALKEKMRAKTAPAVDPLPPDAPKDQPSSEGKKPEAPADDVGACVAQVLIYNDIEAMGIWADALPDAVKADERFTRAFKARMVDIKKGGAK